MTDTTEAPAPTRTEHHILVTLFTDSSTPMADIRAALEGIDGFVQTDNLDWIRADVVRLLERIAVAAESVAR